ncbi:unnamed protein product [Adineta steineri]|uniref:Uncharacterized protein n=1 Tax=Adineta steineri TaxID=433720 RepID=A0A814VH51_9BILA|nr:unnamed protein product [Adineta steineri]CAF1229729.1 unnamed protein product [Adineta steineri]CAF3579364.1 unnamed protein product [Adineta steineri]CAF3715260.1 unnamed protein product [Adineta steineri]
MKIHTIVFLLFLLQDFVALVHNTDLSYSVTEYNNVNTFYSFLSQDGADPWVFKHPTNGWYYATKSTQNNVMIWRSRYLSTLDIGESKIIWTPNDTTACRSVWAPELHLIDNKWYVYFAATTCDDDNINHRMFVLENVNEDPFQGQFQFRGQLTDQTNKWAIDGTVLEHPTTKQLYFIWSGWEGDTDVMQILYIAHMSTPYIIDSERLEISRPTYAWETNHKPFVNEGPQVIIHDQTISLIFSASGSWTNDYCMGLITAHVNSDLMNPSSWKKRADPILKSGNGLFGPGHGSLTINNWLVFHTAMYNGSGWTRQIRTQPFQWNEQDGTPILGELRDPNIPISLPQGEPNRQRYQLDSPIQNPIFDVEVDKTGSYITVIQVRSKEYTKTTTYLITVNKNDIKTIDVFYSDNWSSIIIPIELLKGKNTLAFTNNETTMGEINSIDLFPQTSSTASIYSNSFINFTIFFFVTIYLYF